MEQVIVTAAQRALAALPAKRAVPIVLHRPLSEEEIEIVKAQRARVLLGSFAYSLFIRDLRDIQAEAEACGDKDVAAYVGGFLSGCGEANPDRPQDALHQLEAIAAS